MDKLKELIQGIGGSQELADAICEEMGHWKDRVREKLQTEARQKAEVAKQRCLEEVEREKLRLSRRLKIYLESKASAMADAAQRQYAIEEAESTCTLRRVRGLVEDIEIDDGGTSRRLQEVQKKSARLERANQSLREEQGKLVSSVNQSNKVAKDLLQKNRKLASKLTSLTEAKCKCMKDCKCEGKCTCECSCKKDESKSRKTRTVAESKTQKRRLPRSRRVDEGRRKPGKTRSTRPTLVESQTRRKKTISEGKESGMIDKIASEMTED